jgi:hypothetical protein
MVRLSKPERRRSVSYKRPSLPGKKGPSVQVPPKQHINAVAGEAAVTSFIPKIS